MAALRGKPCIAVLPFDNLSSDPEQEYFSDGVTEDIITALSKHRSLLVVARNSTFAARCIAPRYQTEQWRAGFRKQLADPTQNHPIDSQKWHPIGPAPSQHDDLLPQHEDLGFHRPARPEQTDDNPKYYSAELQHPAEDHPILRLTPTGWDLRQGQARLQKLR